MIRYFRFFWAITLSLSLTTNPLHSTSSALLGSSFSEIETIAKNHPTDWASFNTGNTHYSNLSTRSESQSSIATLDPTKFTFQEIIGGLVNPVFITNAGDGAGRIFVVERVGRIRIIKNGTLLATPFLNIQTKVKSTGSEQGLLALAFHPSYETNGKFYVAYTTTRNGDANGSNLVLEQYSVSAADPDQANSNSGNPLLTISHPTYSNHNGGSLAFGQDGYLIWSTGDGGGGGDPNGNAQNLNSLLGKILRIDVNSGSPYGIPTGNPYYSSMDPNIKKEIWAYGLRNPWRLSFDRLTYDIYIGDVGQSSREEIDFQPSQSAGGENYGWNVMEGSLCYSPATGCNQSGKILPIAQYDHNLGCSVTGGYVYRGSNFPTLNGYYFYGDFCTGEFWSLHNDLNLGWQAVQLINTPYSISTFGEDEGGELYLADYATGKLYNIRYQETHSPSQTEVSIGGNIVGSHNIPYGTTFQTSYAGVDGGPVKVTSTNAAPIVAALRDLWADGGNPSSSIQLMGLPENQLSDTYWFPAYNNVSLDDQLRFGNVGTSPTTVTVTIGGVLRGTYPNLQPNQSIRVNYPGLDSGPVKVQSSGGVKIIASIRDSWHDGTKWSSYAQLMGLPNSQLSDTYWFPAYNNVSLDDQLRFGNVGTSPTVVTVTIGGIVRGSYTLNPNESVRVNYPSLDSGPVKVQSSGGVKIIASIRDAWFDGTKWTSYFQLMGLPFSQLSDTYYFPAYDNVSLDGQLRFGNVGTSPTDVTVTINGVVMNTYHLNPNQSVRVNYAGLDSGPVKIQSSGGVKIIASLRDSWFDGTSWTSYSQLMGLQGGQFTTSYYFPAYNNVTYDNQLRIGVP